MSYNHKKYANTLELNKVLEMLSRETSLPDAAEKLLNLEISTDEDTVAKELGKTFAAYKMLAKSTFPPFGRAVNNASALSRAGIGAVLSFKELLDIGETLRAIRLLSEWHNSSEVGGNTEIDYLFEELSTNKYFEDKIFFSIKNEEDLNDDASPELRNIRRKIVSASVNIRERLDRIIKSPNYAKFLQESIITQRDGRFVVPVKTEFRGEFAGIVHDSSSSGATLFIEPMPIVEINNDLRVLKLKEKEEIDRILSELSAESATFAESIKDSYNALIKLAVIFAKANFAYKQKATMPLINSSGRIVLKNARHPLIDSNKVVPISLTLGIDFNSLIITGPNTGGKTVTLKTIGLLTLMTMCGLMIPCDDSSEICIFDKILVDIGDEQSIEQSLSTFSSHMVNIVNLLNEATPFSLVLLDELGAGTDPIEGAALARAILHKLTLKGCRTASTTHYAELKSYAIDTDGVENACCEFDIDTLKPTYRLLIGVPGRSNAFAISSKLGITDDVIDNAKSYISEENKRFENIIASLETERQNAQRDREAVSKLKAELVTAKLESDKQKELLSAEYDKIILKAREQAINIIENTRRKSNELLNELDELRKKATKGENTGSFTAASRMTQRTLNTMQDDANPVTVKKTSYVLPRDLMVGDSVKLADIEKNGTVLDVKDGKVYVNCGNIKIWTDIKNIILLKNEPKKESRKHTVTGIKSGMERTASTEFDMRGMATDEGIIELDRFIDNAVMTGINTITIIHGKGTGALRNAVQAHLRRHKSIKTFRVGLFGEGENGVTIAEINR